MKSYSKMGEPGRSHETSEPASEGDFSQPDFSLKWWQCVLLSVGCTLFAMIVRGLMPEGFVMFAFSLAVYSLALEVIENRRRRKWLREQLENVRGMVRGIAPRKVDWSADGHRVEATVYGEQGRAVCSCNLTEKAGGKKLRLSLEVVG